MAYRVVYVMEDTTDDGSWMSLPDAAHAAAYATPFPDFGDDSPVNMAVHDTNVAHMVRIAEREASK